MLRNGFRGMLMRMKTLSTALAVLLCIALALPATAADSAKPPETVLRAVADAIAAWFGEIAAEIEAVSGGVPEESATSGPNDGGQAELGPIIFPTG